MPPVTARLRLTLLGVGAMNSPRYPPAGLLVRYRLPFGEWGQPGRTYQLPPHTRGAARQAQ